ncbi:primase, DNA, polypeptide 1 (49kDa) [Terramyces sp. JEL0728]|nr:primase, DNA, polypeptide 1 (49kDa) [Terramyces sp. JEL0728]
MTVDLESRKKQKTDQDQDEYMDNMDVDLLKMEAVDNSDELDFQKLLRLYYQKYFPFNDFYNWLSYGNFVKYSFLNREFSFTLQSDSYLRFLSFKDADELKNEILRLCPVKIDIGAIYNIKPKDKKTVQASAFVPLERELVFDIDMTDYDDIRTCCGGANICLKCWNFMTVSIQVIHSALQDDFGFKHILWVFSGRRGIHCWVCDDRARSLTAESRKAIVHYLELLKGGESQARKVNTKGHILHPILE